MTTIPDVAQKVPRMFRAQVEGRCQLQRIVRDQTSDAQLWVDEWVDKTYPEAPQYSPQVQTRVYSLTWRFVTNGGQDDGVIRPVIGAKGWPIYPGSSMKGVFRRACTPEQTARYCGDRISGGDYNPGILRFHGGYPTNTQWTESLIDIVHPQQNWQVKTDKKEAGAFIQISLYQPELCFGISSTELLSDAEWETIWSLWEKAIALGIGCRVSAGYGQTAIQSGETLYRTILKGQGQAAKLLDGTGEFRPNIFRAAIRGHALRLFGGLTSAQQAERLVENLLGGVQGNGTAGLLSMTFVTSHLEMDSFGSGSYAQPTYEVEGELIWSLAHPLVDTQQREALIKLVEALTRFAMVMGGFGKSWRRADHRLFFPEYYDEGYKPLIGCHWQWAGRRSLTRDVQVRKLEKVSEFIDSVRQTAQTWMTLQGVPTFTDVDKIAPWREAWHPDKVQVWGRIAAEAEDCEAIRWLHQPYRSAIPQIKIREGSIYRTSITGAVGQIGRLWHRMYPYVRLVKDQKALDRPKPLETQQFFELFTLFPEDTTECDDLLHFLQSEQKQFQRLWP